MKANDGTSKAIGRTGSKRTTLTDIAKELGVSHTTVSLALRKHPRISEAMRDKVKQKAEAMGYRPDPMLSALTHYRSTTKTESRQAELAWINPYRDPKRLRAQHEFDLYWQGAELAADQLGFHLEEFATKELSLQRMDAVFKARGIRGIILAELCSSDLRDPSVDWKTFPWQDYAVLRLGRRRTHPDTHHVSSAQMPNTIMAFNRIHQLGYRRVGFVGQHTPNRLFYTGVSYAQFHIPEFRRIPPLVFAEEGDQDQRMAMLDRWLRKTKPDAILSDWHGIELRLEELGYRIPDDIALGTTSMHDTAIDAGIDQNPKEIGRAASHALVSLLNENSFGIPSICREILIEGRWVDGSMLPDRN